MFAPKVTKPHITTSPAGQVPSQRSPFFGPRLGHDLSDQAPFFQGTAGKNLVQRRPDPTKSAAHSPTESHDKTSNDSTQKLSPLVPADLVADLKRGKDDDWEITISGDLTEESTARLIWPSRLPPSVVIRLQFALIEPIERRTFKLSGVAFNTLKTMDPTVKKLFVEHGLEDETKESAAVKDARAKFVANHKGHGEWVLHAIDVALRRITKRNPDLLVSYYEHYARHGLADPHFGHDLDEDATGDTISGDTVINSDVLRLESGFPTDSAISLLASTLMHEFTHTPHGPKENIVATTPKEAKAFGVEVFFSERMGDEQRAAVIYRRYETNDPVTQRTKSKEIFWKTQDILSALYEIIDQGGPAAEEARKMSVEFISKNSDDYGPSLKTFISNRPN